MRQVITLTFSLLLLQGCISSVPTPATTFYVLEEGGKAFAWEQNNQVMAISINRVPDYLRQPNLVMLESNHQLYIATYHQWAGDFKDSLRQALLSDMNELSQTINYVRSCQDCGSIEVTIDTFYATEDGEVLLSGYYEQHDEQNKVKLRHSFAIKQTLSEKGYSGAVKTMRQGIKILAGEMNQKL